MDRLDSQPRPCQRFGGLVLFAVVPALAASDGGASLVTARAAIEEDGARAHVEYLASPELGGRDSPSRGLMLAAEYVARQFADAGLAYAPDALDAWKRGGDGEPPAWSQREASEAPGTYLRPFRVDELARTPLHRPVPDACSLLLEGSADGELQFVYGEDFVPIGGCNGDVRGELVFAGFGISSSKEKYNDFKGLRVRGRVALVLDGEPRHRKRFDGPEVTRSASLWTKLHELERAGALGVLVVRRTPESAESDGAASGPLGFRHTYAAWVGAERDRRYEDLLPALEITEACATALLGTDVAKLASKIDRTARPKKLKLRDRTVSIRARSEPGSVVLHNVVGMVRGSDPELADEFVIIGAHYDHLGVDARGRIGFGADDNASGTAAVIETAQAMALAKPRRSVLFCLFAAEEDGLVGSRRLCQDLPVDESKIVAMLNMDMIGRGDAKEVVLLGIKQNPKLEKVVERAKRMSKTGVRKLKICPDPGLFERSDHFAFHELGIPTVFFFENYPLGKNKDYHTWRDTVDLVDMKKVVNTARLAFNTAWILANDDDRPPRPRN